MREISELAKPRPTEAGILHSDETEVNSNGATSTGKSVARLRLVWEERAFVGRVTIIGLILGVLLAFVIPKEYESTVQLMPPDATGSSTMGMMAAMMDSGGLGGGLTGSGGGGGGGGSGLGAIAGDLLGLKNTGALFVGILASRTIQDRLIDHFDLMNVYSSRHREDARKELSSKTDVSEDRKSGIITIVVTDKKPQRAAAMAQAYVDELDRLSAEVSNTASHRERLFLEARLREVKEDLNKAAGAFSQFSSKNTAIDIEQQGKAMVEAAAAIQGQLIAMEAQLKGLEQIYAANNPRVQSAKSTITELRAQLEKFGGGEAGKPLQNGDMYPSIRQLPLLGVTYYDLYRNLKIEEVVYESLTAQYEAAKVQEVRDTPSVKVLDSAVIPEVKSFPPRFLVMLLCTILALLGAVGWLVGKTRWDQTASNNPGKILALEVFGVVNSRMPWSPPNGSRVQALAHQAWLRIARKSTQDGSQNEK